MADAIRWRTVGGVLVSYFEPGTRASDELVERWLAALREVEVCVLASTGAIEPSASHRRATTQILIERRIRVVIVSEDRANRALAKLLVWMGVAARSLAWSQLEEHGELALDIGPDPAGSFSLLLGPLLGTRLGPLLAGLRDQGSMRLA
jgi:hypothetical protein